MVPSIYDFAVITMTAKNGKKLYLGVDDITGKSVWGVNSYDAIYFDNDDEAESYAQTYFTKFKGWSIEPVYEKME